MESKPQSNSFAALALIAVQIIFGLNYAASRVILNHYPAVFWGGMRMLLGAAMMFVFSFFFVKAENRKLNSEFFRTTLLLGVFGLGLNQAFFLLGLKNTTTVNAAILNTLTPLFTLLFAVIAGTEKFTIKRGFGFLLAVAGALVIRNVEDFHFESQTLRGDLFTILNCAVLAFFFLKSRDFLRRNSPFWSTAWMFLFGGTALVICTFPDAPLVLSSFPDHALWVAIAYNVILATIVTYFLNAWALTKVAPSSVAIFIYLQPVIAVLFAWAFTGEVLTVRMGIAMLLVFLGVALGTNPKLQKKGSHSS